MSADTKLGEVLRELRESHQWKLRDVAAKSGLSVSTLSRVERGKLSLTYDKLVQLAEGLEIDISTLFSGVTNSTETNGLGRRSLHRRGEGELLETDNYCHSYLHADLLKRPFVPIIAELKARSLEEFGPLVRHRGEEFTFVLEGTVVVHTEHYAPCTLEEGDSIHIDSNMGHAYLAGSDSVCRVLSVCSATETMLTQAIAEYDGLRKQKT